MRTITQTTTFTFFKPYETNPDWYYIRIESNSKLSGWVVGYERPDGEISTSSTCYPTPAKQKELENEYQNAL